MWTSKQPTTSRTRDGADDEERKRPDEILVIPTHNFALAALPQTDLIKIVEASEPERVAIGDEVYETGEPINELFFPVDSVMSSVALLEDGTTVEISMTGREGIAGLSAIIGGGRAMHWTRVSAGGVALRISKDSLHRLFTQSEAVQQSVLRAYRSLFTQVAQRSVCNTRHTLLQRLSVWLLMIQDRIGSEHLPFTQDEIAGRISVRRAGVSVAASMLQSMHAISYHRGKIVIVDRYVIEKTACECYKVLGAEFQSENGVLGTRRSFGT